MFINIGSKSKVHAWGWFLPLNMLVFKINFILNMLMDFMLIKKSVPQNIIQNSPVSKLSYFNHAPNYILVVCVIHCVVSKYFDICINLIRCQHFLKNIHKQFPMKVPIRKYLSNHDDPTHLSFCIGAYPNKGIHSITGNSKNYKTLDYLLLFFESINVKSQSA